MTITNHGRIAKATHAELHTVWLTHGYDDIYSFSEYIERLRDCGVEIEEDVE